MSWRTAIKSISLLLMAVSSITPMLAEPAADAQAAPEPGTASQPKVPTPVSDAADLACEAEGALALNAHDYRRAEPLLLQALSNIEKSSNPNKNQLLQVLRQIGRCYCEQNNQ